MRRRLLTLILAIAALLAACGSPVALRTAPVKTDACDEALLAGELVTSTQGGLAGRTPAPPPAGRGPVGATPPPAAPGGVLRRATGKIVAHVGQRVSMGGGGGANGLFNACAGTVMEVSNTGG